MNPPASSSVTHGQASPPPARWPRWFALAAAIGFFALVARFWHPVYHFTAFLQLAEDNGRPKIQALQSTPVFTYPGDAGYDGQYYVQIACDPAIRSDALPDAVDNISYRARRILGPGLAWLLGAGQPAWIVHAYSFLNVLCWPILGWLLWRLLGVTDLRTVLAWAGLMFSAGVLHSVRLALTDLVALTFFAAGFLAIETHRNAIGTALLALSGLGRETSLAAIPGTWSGPWRSPHAWLRNALLSAAIVLPFGLWLLYLGHRFPNLAANPSVLTIPGLGLLEKLQACSSALAHSSDRFLSISTLLAVISIIVQGAYLIVRPKPQERWWRAGLPYVCLLLLVNHEVWEGDPGAITRVLLPLQLAFNILATRHRAPLLLLLAGNLSVFSGLAPYRATATDTHELGAGHVASIAVVARSGNGWYSTEKTWSQSRTWSQAQSHIEFTSWPRSASQSVSLTFKLRAFSPRTVTIRQADTVLWQGALDSQKQPVLLKGVQIVQGRATLDFVSDLPAQSESPATGARQLAYALYDLSIVADTTP